MRNTSKEPPVSELHVTLPEFLRAYNKAIPESFPRASAALLKRFKEENPSFFKQGDFWSLDLHRKRIMDWLPLNSKVESK